MRGKKTLLNTVMNLLLQIVTIVSGFILPRLILQKFGSQYNGLISSINQFLACAILIHSGIGGVTRAALYKPLAENNKDEVNSIMKATDIFMKKIGLILLILIICVAALYPFLIKNEFGWLFTFTLFLIIGISTFAESFLGITYLILLQADQKLWVASIFNIISVILNAVLASILILNNFSIHFVKLGSAVAYCIYPILLNIYVKRKYKLNLKVEPNNKTISQRWDSFWHQFAIFITNNTDVMVLTILTDMYEVSVYSVYNMVINALKNIMLSFSNGVEAAFGNMIVKNEKKILEENLSIIELIIYNFSTIAYTCAILLIIPFITIYTNGINDTNYIRPTFAYIMLIAQFFQSIRNPYQIVIQAAGHYKQTKNGAILEAIINITISVTLVIKFGIIGVAIGTLTSILFRTIQIYIYICTNIIKRSKFIIIKKIIISFIEGIIIMLIISMVNLKIPTNYFEWIINAIIIVVISVIIVIIGALLFYGNDLKNVLLKLNNVFQLKV